MAPVATAVCILFIAWLLRKDARRRPRLSPATWIPTLVVFTIASRSPSQWLDGRFGGNTLDQAYFAGLISASLIVLSIRPVAWGRVAAANPAFILFYGYFALSTLWSFHPIDSLTRVVKDFGLVVLPAMLLLSDRRPSEAIRAVFFRCASVAFPLSLLFSRYYHLGKEFSRNGSQGFRGIGLQKNSLGDMALVYLLFVAWDYLESRSGRADQLWHRRWRGHFALLLTGSYLLYLCHSKSALVGTVVGFVLLAARSMWASSRVVRAAVMGAAISLPVLVLTQGSVFSPVVNALGRDATLTGRTAIWQSINADTVNPLIGSGFWNFWNTPNGQAISDALAGGREGVLTPSAHNGFLDVYLDGGMIGVALLVSLILAAARPVLRVAPRRGFDVVRFIFTVVPLVCNLAESFFARPSALWFATVLVFINYPFREASGGGTNGFTATAAAEVPPLPMIAGVGSGA